MACPERMSRITCKMCSYKDKRQRKQLRKLKTEGHRERRETGIRNRGIEKTKRRGGEKKSKNRMHEGVGFSSVSE